MMVRQLLVMTVSVALCVACQPVPPSAPAAAPSEASTPSPTATVSVTDAVEPTETPTPPAGPLSGEDADASPDGVTAFTSERDGNAEIYITNADGSQPKRLTPTLTSTPTQTPTPTRTPTPTATPTPPPHGVLLAPMNYQAQTLNNCGPASIAIVLGYYDHWITQQKVNEKVDPGPSPCEIANYVHRYDLKARPYWSPQSIDPVRLLLANGIPVIANQRLESSSRMGHYRVVKGYDDAAGVFISDDPLLRMGPDLRMSYETFDELSIPGAFIPVYPPQKDALVRALMRELGVHDFIYCRP